MKLHGINRIMVATVLAVVTAMGGQAQAFQFDEGDTVLAIWGNGTQALYNLSDLPSFSYGAAPQSLNVSAGLAAAQGSNPVWFSLFSSNSTTEVLTGGSRFPTALVSDPSIAFSTVANWAPFSAFQGNTILAANDNSFTSRFGGSADSARVMNGTWNVDMFGSFEDVAGRSNVLQVFEFDAQGQRTIGHFRLNQQGLAEWQRAAFGGGPVVPVPAAVWLFGTGLIGLAGLARRRMQSAA
jgi:hypothetical protein